MGPNMAYLASSRLCKFSTRVTVGDVVLSVQLDMIYKEERCLGISRTHVIVLF